MKKQVMRSMQRDQDVEILSHETPYQGYFRIEKYQDTAFIGNWKASKLHAVHKLLSHINWEGQVMVFGDSSYDDELLKYFDGIRITSEPSDNHQKKEIINV